MSRHAGVMAERSRPGGAIRVRVLGAGLVLACLSALLWGWAARSAVVAALTLVTAIVQVATSRSAAPGSRVDGTPADGSRVEPSLRERLLAPLLTGMVWTAVDVLWARLGVGGWGRF